VELGTLASAVQPPAGADIAVLAGLQRDIADLKSVVQGLLESGISPASAAAQALPATVLANYDAFLDEHDKAITALQDAFKPIQDDIEATPGRNAVKNLTARYDAIDSLMRKVVQALADRGHVPADLLAQCRQPN
jgi:hypothetical protein